jgi:predicted porin
MGRQYDTIFDSLIRYAHGANNGGSQAWHLGGFDRLQGARFNNSVKYQTIKYAGFSAGAVYAFGEGQDSSTNRAWGLGSNYENGAFSAGLAFTSINNVTISPSTAGIGQFLGTATTVGGTARSFALDDQVIVGGGARYVIDRYTVRGLLTSSRFSLGGTSNTLRAYEVGVDYKFSSPLTLTGGYTRQHLGENNWNTFLVSLDYALSKRTDVYVLSNIMKANGGNVVAALAGLGASSDDHQRTYRIGVRHRF